MSLGQNARKRQGERSGSLATYKLRLYSWRVGQESQAYKRLTPLFCLKGFCNVLGIKKAR